jgi:hypothetical protein
MPSGGAALFLIWIRKRDIMDYLIVIATLTMVGLYAILVGRSLPRT